MAATLLAVDLGLRAGLALYGDDGRLRWYRSTNFGCVERLRRGARRLLDEAAGLGFLFAEGHRRYYEIWRREAERRAVEARAVPAEVWRPALLLGRERRSGAEAKASAGRMARQVIEWSGAPRPTSLRHDAAEAILIGLFAVREVGWLAELPRFSHR